jgi:hypothetical protein
MNYIKEYSDDRKKGRNRMNRILRVGIFTTLASFPTWAVQQTLTGQISDSMCGGNHAAMGDMGKNPKECTTSCVKSGGKYVFVSNGKVYAIRNQDFGSLASNAGAKVQVEGDVDKDGKTIAITKIASAGK